MVDGLAPSKANWPLPLCW